MTFRITLGVLLSIGILSSCSRTETITCMEGRLSIYGVGFDPSELSNGMVSFYRPDSAFDSLVSTSQINSYYTPFSPDTSVLNGNAERNFDYIISLPAAGKEYRISKIRLNGLEKQTITYTSGPFGGGKDYTCINEAKSCDVNGQTYYAVKVNSNYYNDKAIFIVK